MAITARYTDPQNSQIEATIDGKVWTGVRLEPDGEINRQLYKWVQAGGQIAAYQAPAPTQQAYSLAIQATIDQAAQSRGYADGQGLATYTNSTIPAWSAEALAFVAWRDQVWAYAYQQLAAVQAQQRAQPTVAALVAELPSVTWP